MISTIARWPRDQTLQVMATSSVLSVLSHYAMEGQHQEVAAAEVLIGYSVEQHCYL